jgi:hypothetical protein
MKREGWDGSTSSSSFSPAPFPFETLLEARVCSPPRSERHSLDARIPAFAKRRGKQALHVELFRGAIFNFCLYRFYRMG